MSRAIRIETDREAYLDRNETLRLLGFAQYRDYLKSELWKIVRQRALDILGNQCRRCSEPATIVHHATYSRETLIGEDVRGLVPVCGRCAKATSLTNKRDHWAKKDGRKVRNLGTTNAMLMKRVAPKESKESGPSPVLCPRCGSPRRSNKELCRPCQKGYSKPNKTPASRLRKIREASEAYAYGSRPKK